MKKSLDHIVLNVKDIQASIKFYTEILDLEAERLEEYFSGKAPFPSVRINEDTVIDLFPPERWFKEHSESRVVTNLNHFCLTFEYDEWLALQKRLKENNINIHRGPTENWGARGIGISIFFYDLDKNEIEVRYYPNQ